VAEKARRRDRITPSHRAQGTGIAGLSSIWAVIHRWLSFGNDGGKQARAVPDRGFLSRRLVQSRVDGRLETMI